MTEYTVDSQLTISLRAKEGGWVFEFESTLGVVGISVIDWVPPSPVVTIRGWMTKTDPERRWKSVMPFADLAPEIKQALKAKASWPDAVEAHS